jgi:UDP-glucose 4-epimerase
MKILVTGAAGFIGSHIVDELILKGHVVIGIDNFSSGKTNNINPNIVFEEIDITSNTLERVFLNEKPEIVIHNAAQVKVKNSMDNPINDAQINIIGTIRLLDYCRKYGVRKFIFASTSGIYGELKDNSLKENSKIDPLSFYAVSKYSSENYIRLYQDIYGINYTIFRYSNVYGPRQGQDGEGGVISTFIQNMLNGEISTIYGDGKQTRDFIYVKDVAKANISALNIGDNKVFNIGSNKTTNINQLYKIISDTLGINSSPKYLPVKVGDILHSKLDNSKAKKFLKWSPSWDLENGLLETIQWYNRSINSQLKNN